MYLIHTIIGNLYMNNNNNITIEAIFATRLYILRLYNYINIIII